jgi:hypothetical protein
MQETYGKTTRMDSEQVNEKKREREAISTYEMGEGGRTEEKRERKKDQKLLCNQKKGTVGDGSISMTNRWQRQYDRVVEMRSKALRWRVNEHDGKVIDR